MVDTQKQIIDDAIASVIGKNPKAGKALLKKHLVKTLERAGHTRARAQQLVKENWGK